MLDNARTVISPTGSLLQPDIANLVARGEGGENELINSPYLKGSYPLIYNILGGKIMYQIF